MINAVEKLEYNENIINILNDESISHLYAVSLYTSDNDMGKESILKRISRIDNILYTINLSGDKIKNKEYWRDLFEKARNINIEDWRELYGENIEGLYAESSRK